MNKKGLQSKLAHFICMIFKVLKGCSVIQGDGVNLAKIENILESVLSNGFSTQNVVFGMGGGLLQVYKYKFFLVVIPILYRKLIGTQ